MRTTMINFMIVLTMTIFSLGCLHIYPAKIFAGELKPVVTLGSPMVMMNKKSQVVIMGTGFKPGQEVKILLTTEDDMQTSLYGTTRPDDPVADKSGTWMTTWTLGNFVSQKVVGAGAYKLTITDSKYNFITHTPIGFVQAKENKKKK